MPDQDPKITELEARLDALVRTQIDFQKEISGIRGELVRLRSRSITADQGSDKASLYSPIERTAAPSTTPTSKPAIQAPGSRPPIQDASSRPPVERESPRKGAPPASATPGQSPPP